MAAKAKPVARDQHGSIMEALSLHSLRDADTVEIAGVLAREFQAIELLLTPILGAGDLALLYRRSLYQARANHPWLTEPSELAQPTAGMVLKSAFEGRDPADAAAAATVLLQSFLDVLDGMIGHSLAERLLGAARHP